ncbi:MAG: hypothetical protein MJ103_07335 [Saccharofermentans sp.]|nr:hypothetical protein [Saccharofermentans sp.]
MKKHIKVLLALSTAACLLAFASCNSGKEKEEELDKVELDLNDYFTYTVMGDYDGVGYIEYSIDYDALWESDDLLHEASREKFMSYINGSFDVNENLSNGDTATWSWEIDKDSINELYEDDDIVVTIQCLDIIVTVDGLPEQEVFNPIDYVEVSFEGVSPFATANLSVSPCDCSLAFSADYSYDISNGDEITVSLNESYISTVEAYCEENNYILGETSATYTVEGLDEYLVSVDQLTDDMISMMSEQAVNVFYSSTSNWEEEAVLVSVEYDGVYFLNSRYPDNLWNHDDMNHCYIILHVTASNPTDGEFSYYYYVEYSGLVLKNDGTLIVDMSRYNHSEGSYFFGSASGDAFMVSNDSTLYYVGNLSVNDFYEKVILTNLVDYDYTTTYTEE